MPTTTAPFADDALLDHLVGEELELLGHIEAERLGGLEVDHQLELGRELHRQVAWLGCPCSKLRCVENG